MKNETQPEIIYQIQKKIYLIGNPNVLENQDITGDPSHDTVSPDSIVYTDLVFTLKHNPSNYYRPVVVLDEGRLRVVGNRTFHKAAIGAGLEEINFDLLLNQEIPLEQLMERYDLKMSGISLQREYFERFLFFKRPPVDLEQSDVDQNIRLNPLNISEEFHKNHCLAYKFLIGDYESDRQKDHEFIARLFNINGYLRSIDGLRTKSGMYGRYIS